MSAYFLSDSKPFIEQGLILLNALKISSLKLLDKVLGHVIEIIKFLSVCSTMHIGKIASLIKTSEISSDDLLSSLLFKSNFVSNEHYKFLYPANLFEHKLFTVMTVLNMVL